MNGDMLKDEFIQKGYIKLDNVFSTTVANECCNIIWSYMENIGIEKDNNVTWPEKCPLEHSFGRDAGYPWSYLFSESFLNGIDSVLEPCRWKSISTGWWMVTFPEMGKEWDVVGRWHVDGHWFLQNIVDSPVDLVCVIYYSDVAEGEGATVVLEGSHQLCIQEILCNTELFGNTELVSKVFDRMSSGGQSLKMVELCGKAGDVFLLHPLLIHGRSTNLSSPPKVRFMSHPNVSLIDRKEFEETENHKLSLLEYSYVVAAKAKDLLPELLRRQKMNSPLVVQKTETNSLISLEECMGFSQFKRQRR